MNDVQKPKEDPIINDDEPTAETDSTRDVGDDDLSQDPEENIQMQSETNASKYFVLIVKTFS